MYTIAGFQENSLPPPPPSIINNYSEVEVISPRILSKSHTLAVLILQWGGGGKTKIRDRRGIFP